MNTKRIFLTFILFITFLCSSILFTSKVYAFSVSNVSTNKKYQTKQNTQGVYIQNKYYTTALDNTGLVITVLDVQSDTLLTTIPTVCTDQAGGQWTTVGNLLYFTCQSSAEIIVIDTATDEYIIYTNPSGTPFDSAGVLSGSKIYFPTSGGSCEIVILNTGESGNIKDDTFEDPIKTPCAEMAAAGLAYNSKVYFPSSVNSEVYVVDIDQKILSIIGMPTTAKNGSMLVNTYKGPMLYLMGNASNVNVIDLTKDVYDSSIQLSGDTNSSFSAVEKNGTTYLYVPSGTGQAVDVIDTSDNSLKQIQTGHTYDSTGVLFGTTLYLSYNGGIDAIDTTQDSLQKTLPTKNTYAYTGTISGNKIYFPTENNGIDVLYLGPELESFTSTTADGVYTTNDTIEIQATFNQPISTDSRMVVTLNTGAKVELTQDSPTTLKGVYTVSKNDTDTPQVDIPTIDSASITSTQTPVVNRTVFSIPSLHSIIDTSTIAVRIKKDTIPAAPVDLKVTATSTALRLDWSMPFSPLTDISDFVIEYRPSLNGEWKIFDDSISTTTSATITNLTNGTSYDIRVSTINLFGTSSPSVIGSGTPFDITPQIPNNSGSSFGGGGGSVFKTPVQIPTQTNNTPATTKIATQSLQNKTTQDGVVGTLLGAGEPNVPAEFKGQVCKRYMREYILPGATNNPEEVKKLQTFLNEHGETLTVDGIYNQDDIDAVKRFQNKYKNQILSPWGIEEATGRVYRTTTAKINLMMCGDPNTQYFTEYLKVGDESLESVKVQDFLNLIFSPISGYPNDRLTLSTTFTKETENKVKEFQTIYRNAVLGPWGLDGATGYFYQTTRALANALVGYHEGEIQLDNGTVFSTK